MILDRELQILIPDTEDIYTDDIKGFFVTLVSLVHNDFRGIEIPTVKTVILRPEYLQTIMSSYKNKLTNSEYLTRAFIASTFHLPTIDIYNISKEWAWVAKLCHLLIFFVQNDLPGRIRQTTIESRRWIDPKNYNHNLWEFCYLEFQA